MTDLREHWDQAYTTKAETAVSWYQLFLAKSLELIGNAAPNVGASVIDIGGGASTLPDNLLKVGYSDVTVSDVSKAALARSQQRIGAEAPFMPFSSADSTSPLGTLIWLNAAAPSIVNNERLAP